MGALAWHQGLQLLRAFQVPKWDGGPKNETQTNVGVSGLVVSKEPPCLYTPHTTLERLYIPLSPF